MTSFDFCEFYLWTRSNTSTFCLVVLREYPFVNISQQGLYFPLVPGEDRWLCTLMVEAGWRLEYCAAAENSTYCPDSFDEFFKQRRRWGPSTLANQVLLINQQQKVRENNDRINFLFILYQIILMISTIIG